MPSICPKYLAFLFSLAAGATTADAALSAARMRLPDGLADADRQPVAGRQGWKTGQELFFGEYHVYDVERGLTKGPDLRILQYDECRRRQLQFPSVGRCIVPPGSFLRDFVSPVAANRAPMV